MKKLLMILLCAFSLHGGGIVVPSDDYLISSGNKLELIYSKSVEKDADKAYAFEQKVINNYENSYGYSLDEVLYLGILSEHNQIANAFSTPIPLNIQMNYIAGSYMVDYMSSTSWLKTLLLHESAHNFQFNPKKNPLSKFSHKLFKNIPYTTMLFVPVFPIPNSLESPFLFEGNAVLNESRFGNGGRLYNGALLAMVITQAKAGYITPKRTYNSHLYFPYGTHHYIVGGFFQLYLAQKYGVDKVNGYFWNFSGQYLPIQTNAIFKESFGKDYESELSDFVDWIKSEYSGFQPTSGELIARSKEHTTLNSDKDEIYFLTSNSKTRPKLNTISKPDGNYKTKSHDFMMGKLFKIDNSYYTSASAYSEVDNIEMGLYDNRGMILQKSRSKILQRVLSDGRFLYFDVNNSFDEPSLYIDGEFYDHVHSSAYSDKDDNIYYFKQNGKRRTLYKNHKPLFSYLGWYGFVVDVDENGIYFVANSKYGSSIFLYNGDIFRVSDGDDVVDAKLIDSDTLLIVSIDSEGYNYIKSPIKRSKGEVFNRSYFFEKSADFNLETKDISSKPTPKPYNSLKNMKLSSLEHSFVAGEDSIDFSLGANFTDPLGQNSARVYISRFDEETIAGVGYENSLYRVRYGMDIYGLLEKDENISSRDFGANIFMSYPLFRSGYRSVDMKLNYHIAHDRDEREPLSLAINFLDIKSYGISRYTNEKKSLSLFALNDRGDFTAGAGYEYFHDLPFELYGGISLKYAKSDTDKRSKRYGIEVNDNIYTTSYDPSIFTMPSIKSDLYVKEIFKGGVSLYKVLNLDAYSFRIPLSLRRESIYAKFNYYDMSFLNDKESDFSEYILGLDLDLLFLHKNPIPLSFEYIYNDKLIDSSRFRVLFDLPL